MDKLLDRFSRYVKVETTAVDDTKDYPSSPGQLELGKMLAQEMEELGLENVGIDQYGIVMGTIPGNVKAPTIAWLAHMDTSPEAKGKNVKPTIHKNYNGKDIVLPGDKSKVIRVDETPRLAELKGKTVITSDGTTLLGADDKAGGGDYHDRRRPLAGEQAAQARAYPRRLYLRRRGRARLRQGGHQEDQRQVCLHARRRRRG